MYKKITVTPLGLSSPSLETTYGYNYILNFVLMLKGFEPSAKTTQINGSYSTTRLGSFSYSSVTNEQYIYSSLGFLTNQFLPEGQVINYSYQQGTPYLSTTTYSDVTLSQQKTFDSFTGLVTRQDDLNQSKQFTYYVDFRPKDIVYNPGLSNESKESYQYDDTARTQTLTDREGYKTLTKFDAWGDPILIQKFTKSGSTVFLETKMDYDGSGHLIKTTETSKDPGTGQQFSRITQYVYDALGRLTQTTFPDSSVQSIAYNDALGSKTITDTLGNKTTLFSDGAGHVTKIIDSLGKTTQYQYDSFGFLKRVTDPNGAIIDYVYNPLGQLLRLDSPYQLQKMSYDKNGNLTQVSKGDAGLYGMEKVTKYSGYDSLGLFKKIELGSSSVAGTQYTKSFVFTANDSNRNANGKFWKVELPSGNVMVYTYDKDGQITQFQTQFSQGPTQTLSYQYFLNGQLASIQDSQGSTSYLYDDAGRLSSISRGGSIVVQTSYSPSWYSHLNQIQFGNGIQTQQSYFLDATTDFIGSQQVKSATGDTLLGQTFTYDFLGNLTQKSVQGTGISPYSLTYSYDALSQLRSAQGGTISFGYTYDSVGNRLQSSTPLSNSNYTRLANTITVASNPFSTLYSFVITQNGQIVSKKVLLNQSKFKNQNFVFDALDNLSQISDQQGSQTVIYDFVYDANQHRIISSKNGVKQKLYVWGNFQSPIVELDGAGTVNKVGIFSPQGEKIAEDYLDNGTFKRRYIVNDPLGTPIILTNQQGQVETRYLLSPYGDQRFDNAKVASSTLQSLSLSNSPLWNSGIVAGQSLGLVSPTGFKLSPGFSAKAGSSFKATAIESLPPSTKISFTGKDFEDELGLYYFNARWYDPDLGSFVSADPKLPDLSQPLSFNPYLYCLNNPLKNLDPDGKRTYAINGIRNTSNQPPKPMVDFVQSLNRMLGRQEVFNTPGIYNQGTYRDLASVALEMVNVNQYSSQITAYIQSDLKNRPLDPGEKLNLIGYSGGGQIAFNVADKLSGEYFVNNLITLGSPYSELTRGNIGQVTHFNSFFDPISYPSMFDFRTSLFDFNSNGSYFWDVRHSGNNSYLNNPKVLDSISRILK